MESKWAFLESKSGTSCGVSLDPLFVLIQFSSQIVNNAHMSGAAITSIAVSITNNLLASRAMDDTLKLWDLRKFVDPIAVVKDLPNFFEETSVSFSPNDKYILTGTSVKKDEGPGKLCIFERDTLKKVEEVEVGRSSVVRSLWHGRINQIVTGTGDGSVQVLYDPNVSLAGIKTAVVKKPKQRMIDDLDLYTWVSRSGFCCAHILY